jgi:hypothetical protein
MIAATPVKEDDAVAKLEALRAQVAAARQAAKENDYEWYLENAALLEGTEDPAPPLGASRPSGAAPAAAPAAPQATAWDLTGSEVQTSALTAAEDAAYRQYRAASTTNTEAAEDVAWTTDLAAEDVDPEFLAYDRQAATIEPTVETGVKGSQAVEAKDRVFVTLAGLGYSAEEAASLVPDAVAMIVDLGFRRPRTARLPADWIQNMPSKARSQRQDTREASKVRKAEAPKARQEEEPPPRRRPSLSSPWADGDDDEGDFEEASSARKRSGFLQNPWAIEVDDNSYGKEDYDDDEDDGDFEGSKGAAGDDMSVYPSLDKFKDLLRAESNLRLTVAGPWIRDYVVAENRVRLALYKWWLKALDEGIGEAPKVRA